jgi:monoamine oxidase
VLKILTETYGIDTLQAEVTAMPTLYTALRARHRPIARVPARERFRLPAIQQRQEELLSVRIPEAAKPRVGQDAIVIGAGFAGLACAYELHHAGYAVTVLEAQRSLGGRVRSLDDVVHGKNVEGGGELIGSNHPTWNAYAAQFSLNFLAVVESSNAPVLLDGRRLTHNQSKKLLAELTEVCNELSDQASTSVPDPSRPWDAPNALSLDRCSLQDWLSARKCSDRCRLALTTMMETDNGVSADRQSLLGNLAMICGGGGRAYWEETELYRCAGGNQQLAQKFAEPLKDRIAFDTQVTRITALNGTMRVFAQGKYYEARDVVLAIPPTQWHDIEFEPNLPTGMKRLQMGKNIKFLMSFETEFWKKDKLSPNRSSDGPVGLTWHSTEMQPGRGHAVVGFSGADQANVCSNWKPTKRTAKYISELRGTYTRIEDTLIDGRLMNWPLDPWVKASYAFPAPEEITRHGGILYEGIGNLHFVGEHTCYGFIGYMEGALHSGRKTPGRTRQPPMILRITADASSINSCERTC